ncbi:MAG: hypothetical protein QT00_C0001G0099 [archaeon GW2011_AR5]|nr:MAG: hypothetical protein QT00_C0001G0099 [archaeon GW2011_AR5]
MAETPVKIFIEKDRLESDCSLLARQMVDSGYRPDVIVGVWRGGAHAAAYVTGALKRLGAPHEHFPATGKSYSGMANRSHMIRVYNMEELSRYVRAHGMGHVCFIDDVIDSSVTGHALVSVAENGLRRADAERAFVVEDGKTREISVGKAAALGPENYVHYRFGMHANGTSYDLQVPMMSDIAPLDTDVCVAAPYQKPYANLTGMKPRFFVSDYDRIDGRDVWLNFPYELEADDITDQELFEQRPNVARILLQ